MRTPFPTRSKTLALEIAEKYSSEHPAFPRYSVKAVMINLIPSNHPWAYAAQAAPVRARIEYESTNAFSFRPGVSAFAQWSCF